MNADYENVMMNNFKMILESFQSEGEVLELDKYVIIHCFMKNDNQEGVSSVLYCFTCITSNASLSLRLNSTSW